MNKEAIYMMLLQVLDDPTQGITIETDTEIDESLTETQTISVCRCVCEDNSQYDCWNVMDAENDTMEFQTNQELMEYLDSIGEFITNAYVESF